MTRDIPDAWTDWDEDAGESWARILVDQFLVGLVRIRAPLLLVVRGELHFLTEIKAAVVAIVVDDMDSPILSATDDSLGEAFPERPLSANLDRGGFSAGDLWFATS